MIRSLEMRRLCPQRSRSSWNPAIEFGSPHSRIPDHQRCQGALCECFTPRKASSFRKVPIVILGCCALCLAVGCSLRMMVHFSLELFFELVRDLVKQLENQLEARPLSDPSRSAVDLALSHGRSQDLRG